MHQNAPWFTIWTPENGIYLTFKSDWQMTDKQQYELCCTFKFQILLTTGTKINTSEPKISKKNVFKINVIGF